MFDFTQSQRLFLPLYGSEYRQPALATTGFDWVTVGNDEYILLTSPDHAKGEIREYFQLPNDTKTVSELMGVIEGGVTGGWGPIAGWMPE